MKSWLFKNGILINKGLLQSPYKWVGFHPLYTANNQVFDHSFIPILTPCPHSLRRTHRHRVHQPVNMATLRSQTLKVKLLVRPTCKIPRSTQRSCSGIRRSLKMCQVNFPKTTHKSTVVFSKTKSSKLFGRGLFIWVILFLLVVLVLVVLRLVLSVVAIAVVAAAVVVVAEDRNSHCL